jgi:hypothetical protein
MQFTGAQKGPQELLPREGEFSLRWFSSAVERMTARAGSGALQLKEPCGDSFSYGEVYPKIHDKLQRGHDYERKRFAVVRL